ncbi:MAG: carbon-nitrogen hydrolase family protein [Fervidicoccaceae archaeon]
MKNRSITLGIVQMESTKDKAKNIEKLNNIINLREADLIITPEYFMYNPSGDEPDRIYMMAEELDGAFASSLKELASKLGVHILATLFTPASKPKVYNEAVIFSPKGEILLRYRKAHLFDAYDYRESEFMLPGNAPSSIIELKGTKISVAICYDIRFPELFRTYALGGAELVIVPSGWYRGDMKEEILHVLGRARAHENTIFLAIVNQYGKNFTGRSTIIGPMGEVIYDLGVGEKYREITIEVSEIEEVRRKLPMLKQRNTAVYKL